MSSKVLKIINYTDIIITAMLLRNLRILRVSKKQKCFTFFAFVTTNNIESKLPKLNWIYINTRIIHYFVYIVKTINRKVRPMSQKI